MRRILSAAVVCLLFLSCAGTPPDRDEKTGTGSGKPAETSREIVLWQVGSPHNGDTPPAAVPVDIEKEARKLGYTIRMKTFPALGFFDVMKSALSGGTQPDILAIDNMGILSGVKTAKGTFTGLNTLPGFKDSLVQVSESLSYMNGWQYLLRNSTGFENARTLALRSPYTGNPDAAGVMGGESFEALKTVSTATATAACSRNSTALSHLCGGRPDEAYYYIHAPVSFDEPPKLSSFWGNERFAFVTVSGCFTGASSLGWKRLLLVMCNTAEGWQPSAVSDQYGFVETLKTSIPLLKGTSDPWEVTATSPEDGEVFEKRFPETERPELVWKSAGPDVAAYLVEFRYGWGNPTVWSSSSFRLVPKTAETGEYRMRAPGIGAQPHRWRIWAISGNGSFSRSSWKTLSYTK